VDAAVVETGRVLAFSTIREKLNAAAPPGPESGGFIVLTDSDGAGFVIRNYLKGALPRKTSVRSRPTSRTCTGKGAAQAPSADRRAS
jgi:5S rRNA maturation endonuclease (ribonuclease M5)